VGLHPENFATVWQEGHFTQYMRNSVMVSSLVVIISVSCSVLAGYAFGTMTFRGSGVLFYLFLLGIMVPTEVIVVPLFFDLRQLGLTDTIWAVALPQVAQSIAFGTYWMRTYFRSSNRSISEAARIDGASSGQILLRVQVPIARPAIMTLVVLVFMWTWNEFLIPLVMSPSGQMRTAPLGLAFFQGQYSTNTALMGAAAVLVALPRCDRVPLPAAALHRRHGRRCHQGLIGWVNAALWGCSRWAGAPTAFAHVVGATPRSWVRGDGRVPARGLDGVQDALVEMVSRRLTLTRQPSFSDSIKVGSSRADDHGP
jgi:raffinose/stachyose/melibiose transport system permease protein